MNFSARSVCSVLRPAARIGAPFSPSTVSVKGRLAIGNALALSAMLLGASQAVHASRTGLNNIPIAAVSEKGSGVVQAYSSFGDNRKPAFLTGARLGFEAAGERFEAGVDSRWRPGSAVPIFLNLKWASHWRQTLPALGLGIAGLAPRELDRDHLGQPQSYVVLSHDLEVARLHGGYAVQAGNNACFFGLDRSWLVAGRKFTFRSDILQIQDGGQWLGSLGFTYKLSEHLGMELWDNLPTRSGASYVTLKFGYGYNY